MLPAGLPAGHGLAAGPRHGHDPTGLDPPGPPGPPGPHPVQEEHHHRLPYGRQGRPQGSSGAGRVRGAHHGHRGDQQ